MTSIAYEDARKLLNEQLRDTLTDMIHDLVMDTAERVAPLGTTEELWVYRRAADAWAECIPKVSEVVGGLALRFPIRTDEMVRRLEAPWRNAAESAAGVALRASYDLLDGEMSADDALDEDVWWDMETTVEGIVMEMTDLTVTRPKR